ncbi:helix-turn-helix domain-containing protein [Candidatus Bathyarchaeota archaeon]|nr:helix-turn-helix domain-containing protein [Candidatus Bathyarchaeota archaeon]
MTEEDDIREEIKNLRNEIASLKEQLREAQERRKEKGYKFYIDIGDNVRESVEEALESVAESIHEELEKSIFIGPRGVKIIKGKIGEREEVHVDFSKTAGVMNALSHEHRLKILKELMSGGKYVNELQEKLPEITTSTLSSHLKILEETGLVVQEKVRGRYLITMPGRAAYKMAIKLAKFVEESDLK